MFQNGLDAFAMWIGGAGALGVFVFGFLNGLLIPVGLHHVLNSYIYYGFGSYTMADGSIVTGEMTRFVSGDPTAGLSLTMFFVMMMFGLPGAALAIYRSAKRNKSKVGGLMGSSAATSFITGIAEPLEFSFMFVAPQLYVAHEVLIGLAGAVCYLFGVRLGFVSGGNISDLVMNWNLGSNVIRIIPIGIVFFGLYFAVFTFLINHFDLKTPGREDDVEVSEDVTEEELNDTLNTKNYAYLAKKLLQCLSGAENIEAEVRCMTRLRIEGHDAAKVVFDECGRCLAAGTTADSSIHGGVHGNYIVDIANAIVNNTRERLVVNVMNKGAIGNFNHDAVVEVPAYVDAAGIEPVSVGYIPQFHKSLMEAQKGYEKLAVEAALEGSCQKAIQAVLLNRTIPSYEVGKAALDDLMEANRPWWPELK